MATTCYYYNYFWGIAWRPTIEEWPLSISFLAYALPPTYEPRDLTTHLKFHFCNARHHDISLEHWIGLRMYPVCRVVLFIISTLKICVTSRTQFITFFLLSWLLFFSFSLVSFLVPAGVHAVNCYQAFEHGISCGKLIITFIYPHIKLLFSVFSWCGTVSPFAIFFLQPFCIRSLF